MTQLPCHLDQTPEYDEPSNIGRFKRPNLDTADVWAFPVNVSGMGARQNRLYTDLVEIYRQSKPAPGASFTLNPTPVTFSDAIAVRDMDVIRAVTPGKPYQNRYWRVQGNPQQATFRANAQSVYAVQIEKPANLP